MPGHKNPFRHEKRPMVTLLTAALAVALFLGSWGVVWASNRADQPDSDGGGPEPTLTATATAAPSGTPAGPTGTSVATATATRTSRAS